MVAEQVVAFGANPAGSSVEAAAGPLVGGWFGLAIIASATDLLSAIGPGDPALHARRRQPSAERQRVVLNSSTSRWLRWRSAYPLAWTPDYRWHGPRRAWARITAALVAVAVAIGIRKAAI